MAFELNFSAFRCRKINNPKAYSAECTEKKKRFVPSLHCTDLPIIAYSPPNFTRALHYI